MCAGERAVQLADCMCNAGWMDGCNLKAERLMRRTGQSYRQTDSNDAGVSMCVFG